MKQRTGEMLMQGKNLNKDERKEKHMERRKNFYAACAVFLLILVIFLGKEVFGENKYNAMENYLSNHYYSKEHIIRAMKNTLGDEYQENDASDYFIFKNFDHYVCQLVLDDINRQESEEMANYNVYMNRSKADEVLERVEEEKQPVEIKLIEDICYVDIDGFTKNYTYDKLKQQEDLLKESKKFIIDLRDNRGGDIEELIDIFSLFYEKGSVVYTMQKGDERIEEKRE